MPGVRKVTTVRRSAFTLALLSALAATSVQAQEEGGYVYNHGEDRFVDNVYNFLKHFPYEQYYWAQHWQFGSSNNYYVDAMDFAYYSGHGNNLFLGMGPGSSSPQYVDIRTAGTTSNGGWGDRDLEFIVFQSCKVIPAPIDVADWWSEWVGPGDVFQGLHMALGYRTNSYSGNGISNNFANRVAGGQAVQPAWFAAVNDERSWWLGSDYPGYASAVYYCGLRYDVYPSYAADPPDNHYSLCIVYQY